MNIDLRTEIVKHIFSNFGIIPSQYLNKIHSLINDNFMIKEKISFEDDFGKTLQNNIWGCQLSIDNQEVKVLLADCTQEDEILEYYLLIHLKEAPAYCMYLNSNNQSKLCYSVDSQLWMDCSIFLQSTFLAGMEQLKEIGFSWNKVSNYDLEYKSLIKFIKDQIAEEDYEG